MLSSLKQLVFQAFHTTVSAVVLPQNATHVTEGSEIVE